MKAGEKNAQQLMESLGSVGTFFKGEDGNQYSHEKFKQFLNALQSQSDEQMYSKIIKYLRLENEHEAVVVLPIKPTRESVQNLENMKQMEGGCKWTKTRRACWSNSAWFGTFVCISMFAHLQFESGEVRQTHR